jgi:mannosyltransferase
VAVSNTAIEDASAFRASRLHLLCLLLIIGGAFALRLYHLDAQSFWSDEGISVIRARFALPELLAYLPVEHVPLYFWGLHEWMQLAGEGDFAVRYFSLLFSLLTVPVIYQLGVTIGRAAFKYATSKGSSAARAVGLCSALLAAINPLQVWYAQEARMYSLLVVLCAAAAWCLLRACAPYFEAAALSGSDRVIPGGRAHWLGFALLSAAALYTHFFAALALAAFGLWSLGAALFQLRRVACSRPRLWPPLVGSFALIGVLFVPWLPRAVDALSFPGWQAVADPLTLPGRYLVAYTLGTTVADEWRWAALGFLVLLALGAAVLVRRRSVLAWLPLCYVFIPFVLLMLLALRKPGYHERYLIVITPLFFVIVAIALYALWIPIGIRRASFAANPIRLVLTITTVLLLVVTSVLSLYNLYFDAAYAKPDFRAAAQYIDRLDRQGDGLIFDGPDPNKAFYRYFSRQKVGAFDGTSFDTQDAAEVDAFLKSQAPQRDRWWVVLYFHPSGPTEDWLARNGYQTSSRWFNGIRVLLYATPMDASLGSLTPQSVETSLPLKIAAIRTLREVHAGDLLPVVVSWQPTGQLPADYQVSVRLVDSEGKTVQQVDRRPLDGRVPTSQWKVGESIEDRYGLLAPADAPTGHYQIEIILYLLSGAETLHARGLPVVLAP